MPSRIRLAALLVVSLATSCTKSGNAKPSPLALRSIELPTCGSIASMSEDDGRLYAVTNGSPGSVCALDVDLELADSNIDALEWSGRAIRGASDQLVDADGRQIIAASWLIDDELLEVGVLRRGPAGIEQLDAIGRRERKLHPGELDVLSVDGRVLVALTPRVHDPSCGDSYKEAVQHILWRPGERPFDVFERDGLRVIHQVAVHEGELLLAGTRELESAKGEMKAPSSRSGELMIYRVALGIPDATTPRELVQRWETLLSQPVGGAPSARALDLTVVDDRVFVLAQTRGQLWLSGLSASDGALAWTQAIGSGDVGALTASDDGVLVTSFGQAWGSELGGIAELRRLEVGTHGAREAARSFEVRVPKQVWVGSIAVGERGRVWLGGGLFKDDVPTDTAWLGVVTHGARGAS